MTPGATASLIGTGPGGALRLVVVDDHPMFRRGLVDALREADFIISGEAAGVADALRLIDAHPPDVAIIDLSLGQESGLDVVSAIAAQHPAVRMLVLSGHDERLYADRALKAGALGYIMKDKAADELLAAVRRVASGKPYVSADTADRLLATLGRSGFAAGQSPFDKVSDRELQVLTLLGRGLTTREIASELGVSAKTIESHYEHLKDKLGARNLRELIRLAVSRVDR